MAIGDYNPCWGNQSLDFFYAELAKDPRIRLALEKEFGGRAASILLKLLDEEELQGDELGALDTILDLVLNESEAEDALGCWGGEGEFPVQVLRFGPVYWIQAPEFDDIGFFDSLKKAIEVAESNFADFIGEFNAQNEGEEVGEEEEEDPKSEKTSSDVDPEDAAHQGLLGFSYLKGLGVPQDDVQAVKWFQKAAAQGDRLSEFWLAHCLENGYGIAEDHEEAAAWFRKSAYQGYRPAMFRLGRCYVVASGVPEDEGEAHVWFDLAVRFGYEEAREGMVDMVRCLTPQALEAAKRRADELEDEIKHRIRQHPPAEEC